LVDKHITLVTQMTVIFIYPRVRARSILVEEFLHVRVRFS